MNYQEVVGLIAQISGNAERIGFPKLFLRFMGSYEGAAFLNQLVFWSGTKKDGWFWKSHLGWSEELSLSEYQVRRFTKQCEELGFLETKLKKVDGTPTLHYRVDAEKFITAILDFFRMDSETFQVSIDTEIISESIDTEIISPSYNILEQKIDKQSIRGEAEKSAKKGKAEEEAEALLRDCYFRLGKHPPSKGDREGRELLALALRLVEDYSYSYCHSLIERVNERHLQLVGEGDRHGIKTPLRYLAGIAEKEKEGYTEKGKTAPQAPAVEPTFETHPHLFTVTLIPTESEIAMQEFLRKKREENDDRSS